jgi:putative ABC transport system substrate-binding protein
MAAEDRGSHVSRRQFVRDAGVVALGVLAGCGRLPGLTGAQPQAVLPRVGFLSGGLSTAPIGTEIVRQGLRDLGYVEGQNLSLEPRYAEGEEQRFAALARELASIPVDVIVAFGSPLVRAAKQATDTIPIVMAATGDPVGEGFVASLSRPGGNITGLSLLTTGLTGKRLELLTAVRPGMQRVAIIGEPASDISFQEAEAAARQLGVQSFVLKVDGPEDLPAAFDLAAQWQVDGLLVVQGHVTVVYSGMVVELATMRHLPSIFDRRDFVAAGGLMAYGPSNAALWRRAAYYVDRILKGAKPEDIPVEQPREFEFVINVRTAQNLGLTIPQHVLLQATEVIQ